MEITSPAKINLVLEILGKRADGYHELRTLMCPVSLHDTVRIRIDKEGIFVRCKAPGVPEDASNLAWRAAAAFCRALETRGKASLPGARIVLEKRIPVGGGLGGGSSNAASVLMGLNRLAGGPLTVSELAALAANLGADVPFFLLGKPALASGIGDRLVAFHGLAPYAVLIVDPGFSISTAAVYANLNLALTKCGKRHKNFAFREIRFEAAHHLCNDLETVVLPRYPVIAAIKKALMENGAQGALMSGSGACVFGLFEDAADARRAFRRLSKSGRWRILQADMMV